MTSFQLNESANGISYLVCEPLQAAGFRNVFSTRSCGDLREVNANRRRFASDINLQKPIVTCHQTHSTDFHFFSKKDNPAAPEKDGDALATDRADVMIGVKTADCVPVLVGDPASGVCAAIHAGWRGTLDRIVEKTLKSLMAQHQFTPSMAIAAVGPSACVDCYEVGPEVIESFRKEFTYAEDLLQKDHLDVTLANVHQLLHVGLSQSNIYVSQYCTMHDTQLFFSHRRESKDSPAVGRMLSLIGKK